MRSRLFAIAAALGCAATVFSTGTAMRAEVTATGDLARLDEKTQGKDGASTQAELPPALARARAEALHEAYAATLVVMHDHYFHNARATVPARALEDAFKELARQSKVEARWISVNTKPMSINHEPKSHFEKQAAAALAKGAEVFDRVEDGYYERAGVIPLTDGCVGCHTGFFAGPPKSPRVAGLVIRVPVHGAPERSLRK